MSTGFDVPLCTAERRDATVLWGLWRFLKLGVGARWTRRHAGASLKTRLKYHFGLAAAGELVLTWNFVMIKSSVSSAYPDSSSRLLIAPCIIRRRCRLEGILCSRVASDIVISKLKTLYWQRTCPKNVSSQFI